MRPAAVGGPGGRAGGGAGAGGGGAGWGGGAGRGRAGSLGWSVSLAGGEQQVLPVHDCRGGAVVVAAGEDSEIVVEGCGLFGVVGDAPVGGDGRSVAGLEVVAEVFGAGEEADPECFPLCRHVGSRAAEQRADVVLAAPQRGRLRAGWGWWGVGLHGGEHLADEAFWGPAEQADGPARAADPDQFAAAGLVVRGEHDPNTGHHGVELAVGEWERLGV